jgi:hypothetical protein
VAGQQGLLKSRGILLFGGKFQPWDKKQNPAIGGICCSQLVLVTQTLPK